MRLAMSSTECYNYGMKHKPKICEHCQSEYSPKYRVTAAYWERSRFCSYKCSRGRERRGKRNDLGKVKTTLDEKFWSKVEIGKKDECWLWNGAKSLQGYGYLRKPLTRTQMMFAHRLSYELHFGEIPDGLCVCHKCDTPACVNPHHLFLGTRADNNADKTQKGRDYDKHGEANPRAKITQEDADEIRELLKAGRTQTSLAKQYGIAQANISMIALNKRWVKEV